ncbi:unnamed protein product [Microthlaspi erraticum]|uniref:Uncharacterized protein n=1 Tax=Microthlaspi erraticum TaxID=1685480 RepID=A0A6D2L6P5_9BRAS|nr:unnamed protein product [Microthlaspi erraticum]
MNHNTNIHFGNRIPDPTRSPRPGLPRSTADAMPHPFPPNRAHPTFEGPSRDEHHYHHHQNRPPVYHQPPRPIASTTTMFSIGGEIPFRCHA